MMITKPLKLPRFQSTLPRRERRLVNSVKKLIYMDFNPRSREGSDTVCRGKSLVSHISIHAPAKGATDRRNDAKCYFKISIHAPAKGATKSSVTIRLHFLDFNPRSREGSDAWNPACLPPCTISIHAPAKGATISH